ncbi:hypothetical protein [Tsukamurella pseudospumae]|uniref:Rv0361 family membrane protein n=1 Tax=Tsukamurella pseudospumae TaxID=239498 RepID=UPI000AC2B2A2|nr:hypothetical protein [Tsukamurella pseudospumae]
MSDLDEVETPGEPTPNKRRGPRVGIAVAAILVVAILVVGLVVASPWRQSDDTSDTETAAREAIGSMVSRYNSGDVEYVKSHSCGELLVRASTDIGGLMDYQGVAAPSAERYKIETVDNYNYYTLSGDSVQIYAHARVKYSGDPVARDHVAFFLLLGAKEKNFKVCTAYLMSAMQASEN